MIILKNLQEYTQQNHISVPIYELITKDGEVHSPTFTIKLKVLDNEFIGIGSSKKKLKKCSNKRNELSKK